MVTDLEQLPVSILRSMIMSVSYVKHYVDITLGHFDLPVPRYTSPGYFDLMLLALVPM